MTEEAHRERRIWTALIIGGVLVVVVAGVLGWGVMSKRLESAKQMDQAIIIVESADASVIAIDKVIRAEVTPEVGQQALELEPTVEPTVAKLTEAIALIEDAYPDLNNAERAKADLLKATAKAKLDMLEQAPVILSANVMVAKAQPLAQQAWDQTLAGDKLADSAVASYNKLTKAGVQDSAVKNAQAEKSFQSARDLFSQAATAFPEAGLDRYVAYVDQKLVQVGISRKSDAAWLAGKPARANTFIAAYNKADAKGIAMYKALPPSPITAIADAYKALADTPTELYFKARDKASAADQSLKAM